MTGENRRQCIHGMALHITSCMQTKMSRIPRQVHSGLLFAGFVTMDRQEYKVLQVDSDRIVQEIQADTDAAEVWKNLSKDISWNK